MQAALRACAKDVGAAPAARDDKSYGEPTQFTPGAEESSDTIPVSVVFDVPVSRPDSILVEIYDGTGRNQKFELETSSSGVDELLELPPASVVPGRKGHP